MLSDNRYREKLKELTEIHLRDRETDIEEIKNPDDENDNIDSQEVEKPDEDMEDNFLENED